MTTLNFIIDAQYKAGRIFGQARGDIDSLDESGKRVSGTGGGLGKLSAMLSSGLVVAAGAAVTAVGGLATAIVASTQKASSLEDQMSGIAAVMGKTREEVAPLKDLILQLGIDPKLKVNATEAANAIEMLGRNGLSMSDIMDGAARNTVLLANATGADFGAAADIATDVMSLFNIEAADMGTAVDGITSVVNNSKFSIDDYRLALAQGGGVAATVGVEFDDFNTTIAAISPLFASGSDAGTSLKTMLQRLNPQSKAAKVAMEELGLITEDGSNQFFDASGNMRSMSEISGLLNGALSGLSDSQRNQALTTIFGSDAMRAAAGTAEAGKVAYTDLETAAKELGVSVDDLAGFADGGITAFEGLQAQMGKVDAEGSAATRVDNLKGSMEILSGIVETLQLRIGEKFLPVVRNMVDALAAFLDNHADDIVAFFDDVVLGVEIAAEAIKRLVGVGETDLPRLKEASNFDLGFLDNIKGETLTDRLENMLAAGIEYLNTVELVNLSEAFSGMFSRAFGDAAEGEGSRLWTAIGDGFRNSFQLTEGGFLDTMVSGFKDAWQAVKDFFGIASPSTLAMGLGWNIWQGLVDGFNGRITEVKGHFSAVLGDIWGAMANVFNTEKLLGFGANILYGLRDGIGNAFETVKNDVSGWMTTLADLVPDIFKLGSPSRLFAGYGMNIMQGLSGGIKAGLGEALSTTEMAMGAVVGTANNITNNNSRQVDNTFNVSFAGSARQNEADEATRLINMLSNTVSVPV